MDVICTAAAAYELMILSMDIFDDLQDKDQSSPPWAQIDDAKSMNIAIGLQALGIELISRIKVDDEYKIIATKKFIDCVMKAVNGQFKDVSRIVTSETDYIEMINEKSGSLVSGACTIGTLLADKQYYCSVETYGHFIGIAAQIQNDIDDVIRIDGKNDLINKRITLPILFILGDEAKPEIVWQYYKGNMSKESMLYQFENTINYVKNSGSIEYSIAVRRMYQLKAFDIIERLQLPNIWKD